MGVQIVLVLSCPKFVRNSRPCRERSKPAPHALYRVRSVQYFTRRPLYSITLLCPLPLSPYVSWHFENHLPESKFQKKKNGDVFLSKTAVLGVVELSMYAPTIERSPPCG